MLFYYYYLHVFSGISFLPVHTRSRKYTSVCKFTSEKALEITSPPTYTTHTTRSTYIFITSASRLFILYGKKITSQSVPPTLISTPPCSHSPFRLFLFSVFGFINVFELTEGTPKNGLLFFIRTEIV